jgi:transcriptional regulator with XRE-family HTH domain
MAPNEISRFVADRLKELRTERGLSLRKLAQRSDLTPEMLSRAERAERTPSLETVARACQGLDVTLAEFFDVGRKSRAPAKAATPAEHFSEAIREIERGLDVLRSQTPARKRGRTSRA